MAGEVAFEGMLGSARALAAGRRPTAAGATLSILSSRSSQRGDLADQVAAASGKELAIQTRLKQTADFREGVAAMAERRAPAFSGQ